MVDPVKVEKDEKAAPAEKKPEAKVRLQNKQAQVLNLLLKDENGKTYTRSLLPRGTLDVKADELTAAVYGLLQRGHIAMNALGMDVKKEEPVKSGPSKDAMSETPGKGFVKAGSNL